MREDLDPYSGRFDDLAGKTCFGRIVSVDPQQRRCRVKTLGRVGSTDDQDLFNVSWINLSSSAEGDEDTVLPTIGAYGVIIFINSEPYILGYYTPIPAAGSAEPTDKVPLLPGDRIIKTFAGNRIIVRSGGSVEIESTKLCRIYLIPSQNIITAVCQNFELETDGGYIRWTRDAKSEVALYRHVIYDNLKPKNAVIIEIGTTAADDIFHLEVGAYDTKAAEIAEPTLQVSISPDGEFLTAIGENFEISVTPEAEMYVKAKKIQLGSDSSDEPIPLGNVLKDFLSALDKQVDALTGQVNAITSALTTLGTGLVTVPPPIGAAITAKGVALVAALVPVTVQLTKIKTELTADKTKFLETDATNILSGLSFTERGEPG